jgi:Tfp pilus assembly protein PilZ
MIAPDPTPGKFGITKQLFKLVGDMSKDQQLVLLRQLLGDEVRIHICKVIAEMTEEQQIILFEQISQTPQMELPIKTVSLDETEASMRQNARKPCLIKAKYKVQDHDHKNYILDISIGGVFIEADTRFPVGRELFVNFSLPNHPQPISFAGEIVWSTARGFGVKFNKVSAFQGEILKTFIEQKK